MWRMGIAQTNFIEEIRMATSRPSLRWESQSYNIYVCRIYACLRGKKLVDVRVATMSFVPAWSLRKQRHIENEYFDVQGHHPQATIVIGACNVYDQILICFYKGGEQHQDDIADNL